MSEIKYIGDKEVEEILTLPEPLVLKYPMKPIQYIKDALNGCWLVISHKANHSGYIPVRRQKHFLAHRYNFILHKGVIPNGMFVLHTCDNPACINPEHLWLGTIKDNNQDRHNKGHTKIKRYFGEENGQAKLTESQIREIIIGKEKLTYYAKKFGVSHQQISNIKKGKKWNKIWQSIHNPQDN